MSKKSLYHDIQETPLAFHKFVKHVQLPLTIIYSIITVIQQMSAEPMFSTWLFSSTALFDVVYLALAITALVGLSKWARYGYYAYLSMLALGIVMVLVLTIAYLISAPEEASEVETQLIVNVIYAIPTIIYYRRRRLLFKAKSGKKAAPPVEPYFSNLNDCDDQYNPVCSPAFAAAPETKESIRSGENGKFCRFCGNKLTIPGAVFCNKCGARLSD